jgi:bleomycin hydrolase
MSYLSFYDKLEKANRYLERIMELVQRPLDDRLVKYITEDPMTDKGDLSDAIWLVKKYGLVPVDIFPESTSSSNTKTMNRILHTKIREHALRLRELDSALRHDVRFGETSDPLAQEKSDRGRLEILRQRKAEYLQEIYDILTVCMGVPPTPSDSFVWEHSDKDDNLVEWTGTPMDFCKSYIGRDEGNSESNDDPLDTISLINDPRYDYGKIIVNEKRGCYVGVEPPRHLNVNSEVIKMAVVKVHSFSNHRCFIPL